MAWVVLLVVLAAAGGFAFWALREAGGGIVQAGQWRLDPKTWRAPDYPAAALGAWAMLALLVHLWNSLGLVLHLQIVGFLRSAALAVGTAAPPLALAFFALALPAHWMSGGRECAPRARAALGLGVVTLLALALIYFALKMPLERLDLVHGALGLACLGLAAWRIKGAGESAVSDADAPVLLAASEEPPVLLQATEDAAGDDAVPILTAATDDGPFSSPALADAPAESAARPMFSFAPEPAPGPAPDPADDPPHPATVEIKLPPPEPATPLPASEPEMMRAVCPRCGKHVRAPSSFAGRTVRCKKCGAPFRLPPA